MTRIATPQRARGETDMARIEHSLIEQPSGGAAQPAPSEKRTCEHEPDAPVAHVHTVRFSLQTGRFAAGAGRLELGPSESA